LTPRSQPLDPGVPAEEGLVSVVIIFLNEERYLREAIESVLAQDYSSWELLLVDDGSADRSPDIAEEYVTQDSRIRYLTHPGRANRGMSASRNLGLAHARGEYVAFLDADDVYLPQRLSRHTEILASRPDIAMTASSYIRWFWADSQTGGSPGLEHPRPLVLSGDVVWQPPAGLLAVTAVPYLHMGTCSWTVRRWVALEVGGFEESFRSLYEDQVFASKVLARYPVYVMQAYLARYRHHGASATRLAKARGNAESADGERFVNWLLGYLDQHGIHDPLLLDMVHNKRPRPDRRTGLMRRLRLRLGAALKSVLGRALPRALYQRLLIVDYELDARRARRMYRRLRRALDERSHIEIPTGEA
jgi:glycosyltransferase involved in cell wall biosynthesis